MGKKPLKKSNVAMKKKNENRFVPSDVPAKVDDTRG